MLAGSGPPRFEAFQVGLKRRPGRPQSRQSELQGRRVFEAGHQIWGASGTMKQATLTIGNLNVGCSHLVGFRFVRGPRKPVRWSRTRHTPMQIRTTRDHRPSMPNVAREDGEKRWKLGGKVDKSMPPVAEWSGHVPPPTQTDARAADSTFGTFLTRECRSTARMSALLSSRAQRHPPGPV